MATKAQAIEAIREKEDFYFHLVWYARKAPPDDDEYWGDAPNDIYLKAQQAMKDLEARCPEEVERLKSADEGDWQHGFNSGMLAGMRYALELLQGTKAQADEEFPFLDT